MNMLIFHSKHIVFSAFFGKIGLFLMNLDLCEGKTKKLDDLLEAKITQPTNVEIIHNVCRLFNDGPDRT